MFGFGENREGQLGIKEDKVNKPVKLDHFGEVEFVDAWTKICTIDQNKSLHTTYGRGYQPEPCLINYYLP